MRDSLECDDPSPLCGSKTCLIKSLYNIASRTMVSHNKAVTGQRTPRRGVLTDLKTTEMYKVARFN
jgi:hypothetical protein